MSAEQALQKARHYCGYQERSHTETKEKLYSFGLRRQEVEEELDYMRSEVMGGVANAGRKRGLLRRGKSPAPLKAAEQLPRPLVQVPTADEAQQPASEEVEEIIERRLFGDG